MFFLRLLAVGVFATILVAATPASACTVQTFRLPSSSNMAPITCLDPRFRAEPGGGHFLSGFDFTFSNGNHKPQIFGLAHRSDLVFDTFSERGLATVRDDTPTTDSVAMVLADPDAEDPLTVSVFYEPHNRPLPIFEVSARDCTGTCRITVSADRDFRENVFLLRGFLFFRDDRFDDNLRELDILPECPDSASDPCFVEVTYKDNDSDEIYDVIIQYSILPEAALIGRSTHEVTARNDDAILRSRRVTTSFRQNRPGGAAVGIERLSIRYTDDDHFVGRIAIMPDEEQSATIVLRDGDNDRSLRNVGYNVTLLGIDREWLAISP